MSDTAVLDAQPADTATVAPPVAPPAAAPAAAPAAQAPAAAPAPAAAEVAYEFKAPEGMELDKDAVGAFTTIAKDLKLAPEAAQKVVDIAVGMQQRAVEAHTAQVAKWADEVKADKELGGDKLPQTLATAQKAMALGPPELKQLLNDSGLGNHPAVVRFMHTVGKALSEDRFVPSTGGAAASPDDAARFYPTMTSKG